MSHILIVGQKFSSLTDYLIEHGHTYTFLQDRTKTRFPDKKFKHRVLADFTNKQTLFEAVDTLPQAPDAVMTTYENYILPASWIADHLHLPGLPVQTAEACTDKFLMRTLFAAANENISPAFATVSSEVDVREFARGHSFPLILKPANLAKSLLVTKSDSLEELVAHYHKSVGLLETIYQKHAPNRTPKLIIEEFLDGTIHSADAFVDGQGEPYVLEQVVDYQTGYDIGFNDNFHYSRIIPSQLSADDQAALRHCASVGIRALGMKNSPAHVEIIMTNGGPRIVEIGARSGGYRERMHGLANGIDITGAALSTALGETPHLQATKNESCAALELFPKESGTFAGIANLPALKKLSSLHYLNIKAKEGQLVGKASDGHKMCAVIILHNPSAVQFQADLEYINHHVKVLTN
jgi:ATP-grasp domain